jgi:hypothetical protein
MTVGPAPTYLPPRRQARVTYGGLVHTTFAICIFCGCISLVEPSPYDFAFVVLFPMWAVAGFRLPRALVPVILLWIVYDIAGFISLVPHWDDPDAVKFQLQSLYLIVTVTFFSIFFATKTTQRLELCLKAYTTGAVFCSIVGVAGYFDLMGLHQYTTMDEGRLSSTFKDANVLGSYLILSALYLTQGLLLGRFRRMGLSALAALLVFGNIFLSFSRGSWGATIAALCMLVGMSLFDGANAKRRRRILFFSGTVFAAVALLVVMALALPATRDMLLQRASLLQSYDVGEGGRFDNQLRSLPMLLDLPNGFGPLRFRVIFGLEPHNSYINAFASYGWLGGFAWLIIVGATIWVGFRLCFAPSPWRRLMHVYWPTCFVLLMQGFQIDIDHWRQLFLCFGAVWGVEAARLAWMRDRRGLAREATRAPQTAAGCGLATTGAFRRLRDSAAS